MARKSREVFFTIPEFAFLVHSTPLSINEALRDGHLKCKQKAKFCHRLVPESELSKYWGEQYRLADVGVVKKAGGKRGK